MEAFVKDFLIHINHLPLWAVFLFFFVSAVLQITFPPYPGDTVLIFGGYLAGAVFSGGNIFVFMPYFLGTLLTSFALYELGSYRGEYILNLRMVNRYFPSSNQEKAKKWVLKFGFIALLLCKFIPGVNSLIILFSGILNYSRVWAYTSVGTAVLIHNVLFFIIGRAIGGNWENIVHFLSLYNKIIISVLAVFIVFYSVYRVRAAAKKKKTLDLGKR